MGHLLPAIIDGLAQQAGTAIFQGFLGDFLVEDIMSQNLLLLGSFK